MANRYLEKIAFSMGHAAMDGAQAVGRVAVKGAKAFTNQVYKATGGAYIDHARKLGVTNVEELAKYTNKRKLWKLDRAKNLGPNPTKEQLKAHGEKFRHETLNNLRKQQTDARITVGAISGGVAYGGSKVKEKLDQPNVNTYQY